MDIRNYLDKMNTSSSARPLNEALGVTAFQLLPSIDGKSRWGYLPEKEYDGQRVAVFELSDSEWAICRFVKGDASVKKAYDARKAAKTPVDAEDETKVESKNSVKEMLKLMSLTEEMFNKSTGALRIDEVTGTLVLSNKTTGPGIDKFDENWVLLEKPEKLDFENCLKACVEIVTGQPVEGGYTTLGFISA
jgi:hypothetical protein